LALAREIQQAFLPQQFISFPRTDSSISGSLQFHHRYQPATELGGDFADILLISEDQAGILVCDVMGHGVRSALVTAVVRGLAEELMSVASDPGQFLTGLNRGLLAVLQRTKTPMFMTAFYIVTDVSAHEMRYASAGHPCPLRRRCGAENGHPEVEYLDLNGEASGPALGVFAEATYDTYTCALCPGDLVMLFTDGLVEVENDAGEVFDEARLQSSVEEKGSMEPAELLEDLLAEARQVSGRDTFEDDVCLVGIEVVGAGGVLSTSHANGAVGHR
jgi:sigma-B regulation protein RsbU (phosphoserine phosphatase)